MIILSIPFRSNQEFSQLKKEYGNNNYYTEIRLDYSPDPTSIDPKYISKNTIITIRNQKEGGIYRCDQSVKIKYRNTIQQRTNCWLDCELFDYDNSAFNPDKLILSYHQTSDNFIYLDKIIAKANNYDFHILKLVLNIDDLDDYFEVSRQLATFSKPVILILSGRLSKLSRLLYRHFGFIGTYVGCPDNQTASNQLDINEAKLYRLDEITASTMVGGLLGGSQVNKSLGLNFYNRFFRSYHLDAIYLPINLKSSDEFLTLLRNPHLKFYGFSITMPFKKSIPKSLGKDGISNLYIAPANNFYNSDKIALDKALKPLGDSSFSVLITGSGSMAELVATTLYRADNIFITGRNSIACENLATKYNLNFINKSCLKNHHFSILINCTSLGVNNEDFLAEFTVNNPSYIIDLPYGKNDTPLIDYCKRNDIDYVDGKMFWKWQSQFQLKKFLEVIKPDL